ncbi:hypothetical protein [Spongiimicrobium sp. 3-5]|uniref:hypothetical protein n=1 Tax=Spongiimicrobium sp. 3-5 TaxID=3332596 RepID=UPI003980EF0B
MKIINLVVLLAISMLTACNGKAQVQDEFWLNTISSRMVLSDANCENQIIDIESFNIDAFLRELKKHHTAKINKAILMFYTEGGEVINFYSIAILVLNEEAKISIYKDGQQLESKLVNKYSERQFNSFFTSIEETEAFNQRKLLVINLQKDSVMCSSYKNLKRISGDKLKKLSFPN